MAHLKIPYETPEEPNVYLKLEVPHKNLLFECIPQEPESIPNIADAVVEAIESPVDGPKFSQLIRRGKKVTFITENQFRQAPAKDILPPLVERAKEAGCEISIIIGCGALPPLSHKEIEMKLGRDLADSGIPILCNNVYESENYRYIGVTRAGTPLYVHKVVAEADVIVTISTTQAVPYGYGGSGMIIPAVVSSETIEINHVLLLAPDCVVGNNDCLMQLDKYEALELAKVDMGINVIVSNQDRVVFVNAGSPVKSHKAAIEHYNRIYEFSIPALKQQKADIAITGSSAPTDHMFFHTGWAVCNCSPAVRDKGIIIMASPCPGYGDWPGFVRMDVLKDFLPASKENLGKATKAFYKRMISGKWTFTWFKIYEVMPQKEVWIVTNKVNLPFCQEIGLTVFESIEEAFSQAMKKCGNEAKVGFIPYGRYTIIR
jgi:nickel-dependent lactate racemase